MMCCWSTATTFVAATPPIVTPVTAKNPEPVMVINMPPAAGPELAAMLSTWVVGPEVGVRLGVRVGVNVGPPPVGVRVGVRVVVRVGVRVGVRVAVGVGVPPLPQELPLSLSLP